MILAGTPLTWHTGELPDSDTSVMAVSEEGDVGEAFHDGEDWRWANASLIGCLVVTYAHLPDSEDVFELIRNGKGADPHG